MFLSEPEERLLALGSAALDGYDDTFSQLTDVDMKFGVLIDEKGRRTPAHAKFFQFISGEARSRFAEARVSISSTPIRGSPIYARHGARLFGESRCFSRARAELSFRARGLAFRDDVPIGGLRRT